MISEFWKYRKCVEILLFLRNVSVATQSRIYRGVDATYSVVERRLRFLEMKGVVRRVRKGRCVYVSLTEKGSKIAEMVYEVNKEIEEGGEEVRSSEVRHEKL